MGTVTVTNNNPIDYQSSGRSYQIKIQATDGTLTTSEITFTINVNNLAPTFDLPEDSDSSDNVVDEGAATNATVGITALATDPAGGTLTYSITYDDSGGAFQINGSTGVVT